MLKQDELWLNEREWAAIDLNLLQTFVDKVIELRLRLDDQYSQATQEILGEINEQTG